jgi:hypothetical protein
LNSFTANQSDTIDDPHSYANKRVLAAIRTRLRVATSEELKNVPQSRLSQVARSVLAENTRMLDRRFLTRH